MKRTCMQLQVMLLLCLAFVCAEAEYVRYKDPSQPVAARVEDLLRRMTLEEKIGQMTQIERMVASADVMKQYYIGSVLSGGGSVPAPKATPATWVNMVNEFQKGAMSTRLQIPMIYGIDAVHGHNNVYGATIFPHNVGLGATRDPDLLQRIGAATALEVRATGIPYTFAPCIAVCRDPRWGRCYESYSEDPTIVKAMTQIIFGLQGTPPANSTKGIPYVAGQRNVAACAKHFVGDGGTTEGINENNTVINYKGLVGIHMTAYFDAIVKGVSTVMVSYSSWNGEKMHANRFLVSHVLKKQLRFKGFVISDWQGIDRITNPAGSNYSLSVMEGVGAGIDMVMVPFNYTDFINDLTYQVKGGIISKNRINDAVRRILRVKFSMGLFEHPMADLTLANQLGSKEHRDLAREAVRKSLVLLKNGKAGSHPWLPLDKKAPKILVAGTHVDNLGYQCGGWTIEWQGLNGNTTIGTTILTAIKSTVTEVSLVNALIHMYVKCGSLDEARKVLDKMDRPDVLSLTAMVSGYAQNGRGEEALELFQQMQQAGMKPISKTFSCVLPACTSLAALEWGMEIHKEIIIREFESDVFVGSALIDMYIKCGSLEKALQLFNELKQRDTVSWTLMIAGYAQNGWGEEALKLFQQMQLAGVMPNSKTFASILSACSDMVALEQGMEIHEQITRSGFQSDVIAITALIDMYAKCGSLQHARGLFDRMHQGDVVSWTAMIAGYAMHGWAHEALKLFEQMRHSGIRPNHVTLLCVLSVCCHAGFVSQGRQYFKCMSEYYHITPGIQHYGCMVDLIGRAGHLDEAQEFVTNMPIKPDAYVWKCLLGACVIHNNVELGEYAAQHLFKLSPTDATPYVLLSNIYAVVGRWDDIEKVRKMMRDRVGKKTPGCSWIEVNKQVHAFITGDG